MFGKWHGVDGEETSGQGCLDSAQGSARFWKDWETIGRTEKHGFAVMEVTSLVADAQVGGAVRIRVEGSASVCPGSQVVNCAGWYSTFLLAAPKQGQIREEGPSIICPSFPLAFGDSDGRAFYRFPTTVVSSPYRVVHHERTSVSSGDARHWFFDCDVGSVQEDLGAQQWIVCTVFCMQQCMSASLGMSVQAQMCSAW